MVYLLILACGNSSVLLLLILGFFCKLLLFFNFFFFHIEALHGIPFGSGCCAAGRNFALTFLLSDTWQQDDVFTTFYNLAFKTVQIIPEL